MPGKRAVQNVLVIRSYTKCRSQLCLKATYIHREVCDIYWEGQMYFSMVSMWVGWLNLRAGCSNLKVLLVLVVLQQQRPNVTSNKSGIWPPTPPPPKKIQIYLETLARITYMSLSQVHKILKNHLKLKKINAQWIPHLLTNEQKKTPVADAKNCSKYTHYIAKWHLMACDETWIFYESKRKCSNTVWAERIEWRPIVAKRTQTVKKIVYVIFSDSKSLVL